MKDDKVIIEQNREQIEKDLYPYERKAWLLNLFLDRMEEVDYPLKEVTEIANVLATGAEKYIRQQIVSSAPLELAGGIRLNRDMIFDAVETPDLTEVVSVERLLKQYHTIPLSALAFQDGRFSVPEDLKREIVKRHTRYAETPRQAEVFHDAKKLVAEINKFHKKYGPATGNRGWHHLAQIESLWTWNGKTESYEVNTKLILAGHLEKQ